MTSIDEHVAVTDRISRILEETLSLKAPSPDVDLIDAGLLDSLAIVRLIVALEQEFAIEVPLEQLNVADLRTIASIGRLATNAGELAPVDPGLVRLTDGTDGLPVFVFPGVAGEALGMLALTRRLTTQRPVFGIEAWGDPARRGQPATIEARAQSSLRALRCAAPHGPYALIGFSFGGLVAFEAARQLREAGEAVDLLILIDTSADTRSLPPGALLAHRLGRPWRYARNLLSDPRHRVPHYASRLRARLQPAALPPMPAGHAREHELGDAALAAYRPRRYDGDAVLFATPESNPASCPPRKIWRAAVAGELAIKWIPNSHGEILAVTADQLATETNALLQ